MIDYFLKNELPLLSIHGHGSPARGGQLPAGMGGVAGGSKRGSVNFVLKKFFAKKGVFNEKNTIFEPFLIFYLKSLIFSSISIDFFTIFQFLGSPEGSLILFPRP
jgi:hypothetical protein